MVGWLDTLGVVGGCWFWLCTDALKHLEGVRCLAADLEGCALADNALQKKIRELNSLNISPWDTFNHVILCIREYAYQQQ